jgi:hypothetical protein
MNTNAPIKRNEVLKPLSHEHHHGLLLCWKIKTGIKKNIETARIKKYADWFYHSHLLPHFEMEEKFVFTILGEENELVKKAIAEHRRISELFDDAKAMSTNLSLIADELESHIRFEERILFDEIQKIATVEQLQFIKANHSDEKFADNISDMFWE